MQDLLLLSKDTPIAKIVGDTIEPIIPQRLPFIYSVPTMSARGWNPVLSMGIALIPDC